MKSDHFFAAVSVSHQLMFITMFFSSVNLARWLLFAWQEEIYKLFSTDVAFNAYDNLWYLYDAIFRHYLDYFGCISSGTSYSFLITRFHK